MTPLSEMSIGNRIALTFAIVLAILFALALFGYLGGRWDDAQAQGAPSHLYDGISFDAKLLELDKRALDESYHAQILKLFSVWLVSGAPKEAKQFSNGLHIARRAYNQAAAQIAKREREQQDQPQQR